MMLLLAKSSILALQYQWRRLQLKDIDITNIDRPSIRYRENGNKEQSGRKVTADCEKSKPACAMFCTAMLVEYMFLLVQLVPGLWVQSCIIAPIQRTHFTAASQ